MHELFKLSMSPIELLVRGSAMYWFLLLLFRYVLRRDAGNAAVPDLLFVVLLGDAAQNGMIGDGHTVMDSALLIAVLAAWNYALDVLGYYVPLIARFNDPPSLLLAQDGRFVHRTMRREHITPDEIYAALHAEGLEHLSEAKRIRLEPEGTISIIKCKNK
jgi:uncharacterized membrane protein YcaP (DUF421 family)